MTNDVAIAYCAGLFDGEGHVGIKKTQSYKCQGRATPGYHARLGIKMVDEEAIKFFADTLGGWYWGEKASLVNGRPYFTYQATDSKAEGILRVLLPHLKVKHAQALVVLALRELQATGREHRTKVTGTRLFARRYGEPCVVETKSFSDEYVAMCDALHKECKLLNHAGLL